MTDWLNLHDAVDFASQQAGDGPGWNRRFRQALDQCGYEMIAWPVKYDRPTNSIDAPLPFPGDADPWTIPSVIVRKD